MAPFFAGTSDSVLEQATSSVLEQVTSSVLEQVTFRWDEDDVCFVPTGKLYNLSYIIFIVLSHWNISPQLDI